MHALTHYSWPGNVRELENVCERMAQICTCGTVRIGCLPTALLFNQSADEPGQQGGSDSTANSVSLDDRLREVETSLVTWALQVSGGNKSKAAELLKIKRSTLGDRLKRLGVSSADHEDAAGEKRDR